MDTIFALATAQGKAGVAVVRLSGPDAHSAVEKLTGSLPAARQASLRRLSFDNEVIDQALVLIFEKGKSFTGEDCAEIHLHGSRAIISKALGVLSGFSGLRLAEPGEFTRRALENGCLDLSQVEALADLIDAETEGQRKQAMRVFEGALGAKVAIWRKRLIRAAALVEATIDFADEDVPTDVRPEVTLIIQELIAELQAELRGTKAAERVRDGFEVAILGAPNAGKSTLLNALAGREAAITSEVAGTTRDVIEVRMDIAGLAVTLLDTAGLRDTDDLVEGMGITRAVQRAQTADLRLFLLSHADEVLIVPAQPGDLLVVGKADLTGDTSAISGLTGYGLEALMLQIQERLVHKAAPAGLLIRARQSNAMLTSVGLLMVALESCANGLVLPELIAADLRFATRSLEAMVGMVDVEHLLDEVFMSFCIGK
jgi:tRNA modification GTPase